MLGARVAAEAGQQISRLIESVELVVSGKTEAVRLAVVGLVAGGHVLIEDVPGTGKTTLARALARSIGVTLSRVQMTSDLLPADVLGVSVYSAATERFVFQPGPIFAEVVLADELNRTTPRTQSSLLEAMSEGRVSVDGKTHALPRPFMVIATQNPIAFEGTYPLPESQLDRFLLCIRMGYPDREFERIMVRMHIEGSALDRIEPVLSIGEVLALIEQRAAVHVDDEIVDYALDLVAATRNSDRLLLGASPRAALALLSAVQALALSGGRDHGIPDDVKALAVPVLAHRVVPVQIDARSEPETEEILARIVESVQAPR